MLNRLSLADLRIRQINRPKMDGGFHRRRHEHFPYQYICFLCLHWECACIENVASFADIPNLLCRNWKILLTYGWFVCSMFLDSGVDATSLFVSLEVQCFFSSLCVWSWSTRMLFPAAIPTSFLTSVFTGMTRDPKLCEEIFSFLGLRITRLMGPRFRQYHGLWFCHWRAFTSSRLLMFLDMALCFLTWSSERKSPKCLQENIKKLIMLDKQGRRPTLVRMSASWFSVSTYLIWTLGSKLILLNKQSRATLWVLDTCLQTTNQEQLCEFLTHVFKQPIKSNSVSSWHMSSNNHSRASLWVLDTCLIVGLRPFIVILITASLCSKLYSWDSLWEECVFFENVIHLTHLVNLQFSGDMLGLGSGIKNHPSFLVAGMFGLSFVIGSMWTFD